MRLWSDGGASDMLQVWGVFASHSYSVRHRCLPVSEGVLQMG
jgi:hypothetical protein